MKNLPLYKSWNGKVFKTDRELADGFMLSDYFRRWKYAEISMWFAICLYISQQLGFYSTGQAWDDVELAVRKKLELQVQVKL